MVRAFLIKYAEIGIKGKNRYVFENALVRRVRERLDRCVGEFMVEKEQGRVYVEALSDDFDKEEVMEGLSHVFGIAHWVTAHSHSKYLPNEAIKNMR